MLCNQGTPKNVRLEGEKELGEWPGQGYWTRVQKYRREHGLDHKGPAGIDATAPQKQNQRHYTSSSF